VKLNRVGSYAFISTDNEKKKKMHTTDGIVAVELQTTTKSFLEQLTTEGMGGNILPKREGQVFFGAPMDRFTCGMRTFLSCGRTGALTNNREEDGMYLLFKDGLESGNEEDQNNKKKQVKDFVTYLVQEGMKQTGIDNEETTHVTVDCSLRQSQFCTFSKERTAPLVEMTYKQHEEMEAEGGLCVHALVPLSKDGLFVRFFTTKTTGRAQSLK
jgi:hypothetical protein